MNLQGLEADVKEKPYLLLIPVAVVVGYVVLARKGSPNATTNKNTAPGSLAQMPATTNVSTDMLANAMQDLQSSFTDSIQSLTTKESTDIQNLGTQLTGSVQTTQAAIAAQSQDYAEKIAGLQQSINQSTAAATGNMNLQASSALQARNRIGDDTIISTFAKFGLPGWTGLQYVAENKTLPASVPELEAWLNSHGYRDPASGKFTSIVNGGVVPTNVQNELTSAYGS